MPAGPGPAFSSGVAIIEPPGYGLPIPPFLGIGPGSPVLPPAAAAPPGGTWGPPMPRLNTHPATPSGSGGSGPGPGRQPPVVPVLPDAATLPPVGAVRWGPSTAGPALQPPGR